MAHDLNAHVDAETLAAWADNGLPPRDVTAVEAHFAECAACRAVAAAFARAEAPAAALPAATTRAPIAAPPNAMRWALPIAASVILVTGVSWALWNRLARPPQPSVDSTLAVAQTSPPAPAPSGPEPQATTSASRSSTSAQPKATSQRPVAAPPPPAPAAAQAPAPSAPPPVVSPRPIAPSIAAALPSPPPPVPPASVPPASAASNAAGSGRLAATNAAEDRRDAWTVIPITSQKSGVQEMFATADRSTAIVTGAGRAGGRGGGRVAANTDAPPTRWRISSPRTIERSVDNGATWLPVTFVGELPPGVTGSSPSSTVCWIVGPNGLVMLTADGKSFNRLSFPERVDLTSVLAQDARHATVIAADGRTFITDDSGVTWRAVK